MAQCLRRFRGEGGEGYQGVLSGGEGGGRVALQYMNSLYTNEWHESEPADLDTGSDG